MRTLAELDALLAVGWWCTAQQMLDLRVSLRIRGSMETVLRIDVSANLAASMGRVHFCPYNATADEKR